MNYLRTTLPIFTVVLGLFGAFSAHSQTTESVADASSTTDTKNPCVFEVHPEHGADEEQLIKDSLAKLAEFDECMMVKFDNASASQSAVAGGSASQGGSGVAGSATSPSITTGGSSASHGGPGGAGSATSPSTSTGDGAEKPSSQYSAGEIGTPPVNPNTISQTTESVADASSVTDTKNPCVFEVRPEYGADKEQLYKDSLAKLAEFDECIMEKSDNAGVGLSVARGSSTSQGGSGVAGSATSPSTATGIESEAPSSQESSAELATSQVSSDALKNATGSITGKLDQTMPQLDSSLKEDSVAKILREAAEKETDPVRKASLLKSYQDYVNSANSRRN